MRTSPAGRYPSHDGELQGRLGLRILAEKPVIEITDGCSENMYTNYRRSLDQLERTRSYCVRSP